MDVHQLLESIAGHVNNVYGDPIAVGNRTVIPIARFRYGFGGGSGRNKGDGSTPGGGGGGRLSAQPAGALEITPEGTRFIPFEDTRKLGAALALGFLLGAAVVALSRRRRVRNSDTVIAEESCSN